MLLKNLKKHYQVASTAQKEWDFVKFGTSLVFFKKNGRAGHQSTSHFGQLEICPSRLSIIDEESSRSQKIQNKSDKPIVIPLVFFYVLLKFLCVPLNVSKPKSFNSLTTDSQLKLP